MSLRYDLALAFITLIWGTTFVVVKVTTERVDPMVFIAARFALGAIALLVLFGGRALAAGPPLWWRGTILGLLLGVGFVFQTYGLRETSPARAAFITGLNVVIVPLMSAALLRMAPPRRLIIAIALSAAGTVVLSAPLSPDEWSSGSTRGDLLVLVCAIFFAAHIVGISRFATRVESGPSTAVQLTVVAVVAGAWVLGSGASLPTERDLWWPIGYMGVAATAFVFLVQNWAQRHTTATRAALIFTLEPVFAALYSAVVYGEELTPRVLIGGGTILAGILVSEIGGETG
ncbi:MAG: DMT family transporter [Chloroflexota bacterium]|nr:MAG: DMT family transporter [Chloroflexota bacterium]